MAAWRPVSLSGYLCQDAPYRPPHRCPRPLLCKAKEDVSYTKVLPYIALRIPLLAWIGTAQPSVAPRRGRRISVHVALIRTRYSPSRSAAVPAQAVWPLKWTFIPSHLPALHQWLAQAGLAFLGVAVPAAIQYVERRIVAHAALLARRKQDETYFRSVFLARLMSDPLQESLIESFDTA